MCKSLRVEATLEDLVKRIGFASIMRCNGAVGGDEHAARSGGWFTMRWRLPTARENGSMVQYSEVEIKERRS